MASQLQTNILQQLKTEPQRDWSVGFLTGHRFRVILYMVICMLLLYDIQSWLWPVAVQPHTLLDNIEAWGSLLWLVAVIPGSMGLAGMLAFRHPKPQKLDNVQPINKLVAWRIVSRGTNIEALTKTIRRCQAEMKKTPLSLCYRSSN